MFWRSISWTRQYGISPWHYMQTLEHKHLSAAEFTALMAALPWPENAALAVAVSGGPDSMALTLLLRDWTATHNIRLQAFTVDHALRAESAAEAARVGQWCAALGVAHEILRWEHPPIAGRLQEQARQARYALLADACHRHDITALTLAHHQDDQAETILLRFAKGSGIDGLAGMQAVSRWDTPPSSTHPSSLRRQGSHFLDTGANGEKWDPCLRRDDGIFLLRPLLAIPKTRLIATCQTYGQEYCTDPGNATPRFARGRLRNSMTALAAEGLDANRLTDLAARAALASDALQEYTNRLLTRAARYDASGYVELDLRLCDQEPEEIQLRAIAALLRHIGGNAYAPKQAALQELLAALRQPDPPRRTLQGCEVAAHDGLCRIIREHAAITDHIPLAPGQSALWDRRFRITLHPDAPDHLAIAPLGQLTHAQTDAVAPGLRQKIGMGRVRATMPALFHAQTLMGVPGYGAAAHYAQLQAVMPGDAAGNILDQRAK